MVSPTNSSSVLRTCETLNFNVLLLAFQARIHDRIGSSDPPSIHHQHGFPTSVLRSELCSLNTVHMEDFLDRSHLIFPSLCHYERQA